MFGQMKLGRFGHEHPSVWIVFADWKAGLKRIAALEWCVFAPSDSSCCAPSHRGACTAVLHFRIARTILKMHFFWTRTTRTLHLSICHRCASLKPWGSHARECKRTIDELSTESASFQASIPEAVGTRRSVCHAALQPRQFPPKCGYRRRVRRGTRDRKQTPTLRYNSPPRAVASRFLLRVLRKAQG